MNAGAISVAVLDYVAALLPGVVLVAMEEDGVRPGTPHIGGMLVSIAPVAVPEPAYSTVTRELDAGARQMVDVSYMIEAYGADALDWCRLVAGMWLTRGGAAAALRATGVQPYGVDEVTEVTAYVDTGHEPRAQCIVRAYAPWTSPEVLVSSAGTTEVVDLTLDLEDVSGAVRTTATVTVDDVYLALDNGFALLLDDATPLLLVT